MKRPFAGHCFAPCMLLLALGSATLAHANTIKVSETAAPPSSDEIHVAAEEDPNTALDKKWHFSTITYIWAAGAKGHIDVIERVEPVGVDLSFGDVLKHLKFVFMGAAEARRDRLIFIGDLMWVHLGANKGLKIRDAGFVDGNLDSKNLAVTVLGGYRAIAKGPVILDVLAGGRLNSVENSLLLTGPNHIASGDIKKTWVDPVVTARANVRLAPKFSLAVYGDMGGILVGSKFTWQGVASLGYELNPKMRLQGGWRYFKVNFRDGDFLYNVAQSGPFVALRYRL